MYQGKYQASASKRPRKWNKSFALLASVLVLVLGLVGGTVAYLITQTEPVQNQFEYAKVSCQVEEVFDGVTKSYVTIKNTSNIPAYIRAAVIFTWQNGEGEVYGQPVQVDDYKITYGNGWIEMGGYYYYPSAVAVDGNTEKLIESCTAVQGKAPAGYFLCVEIVAEAIQSEPAEAVREAWGVTVTDGKISKQGG